MAKKEAEKVTKKTSKKTVNEEPKIELPKENKELEAVEIATVNEEKKSNPVTIIIFFIILIGFAFGLPYIEDFVNKLKGNEKIIEPTPEEKPNADPGESEEVIYFELNKADFQFKNLNFSNFSLTSTDGNKIKFKVSITGDQTIDLKNLNYYLELFDGEKMFLERVKIVSESVVAKNNSVVLEFNILEDTFKRTKNIRIVEKTVDDYPEVTLKTNEEKEEYLTCVDGDHKLVYYFKDNSLLRLNETTVYNKGVNLEVYNSVITARREDVTNLNNQAGFKSSLAESNSGFTISTTINYGEVAVASLNKVYYFNKSTLAKTIKFEMESMRYNCN